MLRASLDARDQVTGHRVAQAGAPDEHLDVPRTRGEKHAGLFGRVGTVNHGYLRVGAKSGLGRGRGAWSVKAVLTISTDVRIVSPQVTPIA
jgi:hypothetical protein